jgi:hypothetical protein
LNPPLAGFLLPDGCKGNLMETSAALWRELLRWIGDGSVTACILAAVLATCFLAFGFGAASELVGTLLILGVTTAVVEARLHAKNRR